jgi:hypothetical protein
MRFGLADSSKAFQTTNKFACRCKHSIRIGDGGKGTLEFSVLKRQNRVGTLHHPGLRPQRLNLFNGLRLRKCFRQCLIFRSDGLCSLPPGSRCRSLSVLTGKRPSKGENGRKYALGLRRCCVPIYSSKTVRLSMPSGRLEFGILRRSAPLLRSR